MDEFDGTGLMAVEPRDAAFDEDLLYKGIYPPRILGETTLRGGYVGDGCRVFPETPISLSAGQPF